ncbi:hypothetical protein P8609_10965 [Lysobacter sp. UC]|uniref:DUF2269 family protein n=1 Tax=Lysobacter arvi TaxID=3038776 RepID=A0ABU1CE61_9GAMM|nr:hypothetical protein [Lysobacter arvi]
MTFWIIVIFVASITVKFVLSRALAPDVAVPMTLAAHVVLVTAIVRMEGRCVFSRLRYVVALVPTLILFFAGVALSFEERALWGGGYAFCVKAIVFIAGPVFISSIWVLAQDRKRPASLLRRCAVWTFMPMAAIASLILILIPALPPVI